MEDITLTGEPVFVPVPLQYTGFLCIFDVGHAWNLRQFLQELHKHTSPTPHHTLLCKRKVQLRKSRCSLYLELLLKPRAPGLWVLFPHVCNDCPQLVGNHSSVSTAQVFINGIMDEGILVLVEDQSALLMNDYISKTLTQL